MHQSCLHTASGVNFDFLNPREKDINLGDILLSLSREPRYVGHTSRWYSVLEHSVRGAKLLQRVSRAHALEFLLHDAAEAYTGDIPTPLKLLLPELKRIEQGIDVVIRRKFGLPEEMSAEVKAMDLAMCAAEKSAFKPNAGRWEMLDAITPAPVNFNDSTDISKSGLRRAAMDMFVTLSETCNA